jgi:hypothetical protein
VTEEEWVTLQVLEGIEGNEPARVDVIVDEVREAAARSGTVPEHKVDNVLIIRALTDFERRDPPLVTNDFLPEDVDQLGRPRSDAARVWSLTSDGDVERQRLGRLV